MTATVHPLPRVSRRPSGPGVRTRAGAVGVLLAIGLVATALIHAAGRDARAIRELPADARAALYARTLQNLESICGADSASMLPDLCNDQARLALAFPECDAGCTRVARAVLRTPTR